MKRECASIIKGINPFAMKFQVCKGRGRDGTKKQTFFCAMHVHLEILNDSRSSSSKAPHSLLSCQTGPKVRQQLFILAHMEKHKIITLTFLPTYKANITTWYYLICSDEFDNCET
jgi:hypothetical protein